MTKPFSKMSRDELLAYCRQLYERDGVTALSYQALSKYKGLYYNLYKSGLNQKTLLSILEVQTAYKSNTATWTWERIVEETKAVKNKMGFLPPAGWFQKNGKASLVAATYSLKHSWEDLRIELDDFQNSSFVESRNGMRWRSHPEASLSNFLYARGIEHKRGEKYPEDYASHSDSNYAYFDLHFLNKRNEWVDVEIWGDKPHGHNEVTYKSKRLHKEKYNASNPNFIGIHFNDCYSDEKLTEILKSHIGVISPFIFNKSTDQLIHTTHWSNADELLEYCKQIAASMPDGNFPTEEWLRKRGKWKNRTGETYNTVSIYIKTWLGGVRNLRKLLNQEHASTNAWDKESAIDAYRAFYGRHGLTPGQIRHLYRKGEKTISPQLAKQATNITAAVEKYSGGSAAVNQLLGIQISYIRRREQKVPESN